MRVCVYAWQYFTASVCKGGHGRPGSASPVEARGGACLSTALCWLIPFAQPGAELDDALVPVLWQQQHEETQADDEHGDEAHRVEVNLARVEVHHCEIKRYRKQQLMDRCKKQYAKLY